MQASVALETRARARIEGVVSNITGGALRLTLEGPGFARVSKTVGNGQRFELPTVGFAEGTAVLTATSAEGRTTSVRIRRLGPTGRRMCWIEDGRLVVDGKAVLRRNLYGETGYACSDEFKARLASDDLGTTSSMVQRGCEFGRLVPKSEEQEGRKHQMPSAKVMEAVRKCVESSKDHDFAYWYVCDEPECRGISPVYLRHIYEYMKELDPYHPTMMCSRDAGRYIDSCDWIDVHPYLAPYRASDGTRRHGVALNTFANYVDPIIAQERFDKVIGCTPMAFSYSGRDPRQDYPTFNEYVASVWTILAAGGRSIFPFIACALGGSPTSYESVRYVFKSSEALEDFLLFGTRRRLVRTEEWEAAQWKKDGEELLVVINYRADAQTVRVPGLSGRFQEFRGARRWTCDAEGLAVSLGPYETVVALTGDRGAGLPSREETERTIARLEFERTHRDNQLLGRYQEIVCTASHPLSSQCAMFDGLYDQQAEAIRGGNPWYEMSFPDGSVSFDRIRLHGENIERVRSFVRRQGCWHEIVPIRKGVSGSCLTLNFGKTENAVRLRFEFGKDHVNLHEIELPYLPGQTRHACPEWGTVAEVRGPKPTPGSYGLPGQSHLVFDASNADWHAGWSGSKWYNGPTNTIVKYPDGGFSLGPNGGTHALNFDPKWKWAEIGVYRRGHQPDPGAYANWSVVLRNHQSFAGTVRSCEPGLYTIPIRPVSEGGKAPNYVSQCGRNMIVPLSYIRFSEMPPTRFGVKSLTSTNGTVRIGDVIRLRLSLEHPCDDVTCEIVRDLLGFYPVSVNGSSSLELRQLDEKGCRWGADVEIREFWDVAVGKQVYARVKTYGKGASRTILTTLPDFAGPGRKTRQEEKGK